MLENEIIFNDEVLVYNVVCIDVYAFVFIVNQLFQAFKHYWFNDCRICSVGRVVYFSDSALD